MRFNKKKFFHSVNWLPRPEQWAVHESEKRFRMLSAGVRFGKALWIETPILTSKGWKVMRDISIGDFVFGEDGEMTRVLKTTDIMLDRDCYKVTFSGGSSIIADADHEWKVWSRSYRKWLLRKYEVRKQLREPEIKTTQELIKDLIYTRKNGRQESNYFIPTCSPVRNEELKLEIPPYVLGIWLGDGTSADASFTCSYKDFEIVEQVKKHGVEVREYKTLDLASGRFGLGSGDRSQKARSNSIQAQLRKMNLLKNKHIPQKYFMSSVKQRVELLKGLMDSDGYIGKVPCSKDGYNRCSGRCEITLVNKRLAEDVRELVWSLGMKANFYMGDAKIDGRFISKKYRVNFRPTMQVFSLTRKAKRFVENCSANMKRRYIKSIEKVKSVPVKCIEVDNESHMYLAGKSLIPTCNSKLSAFSALAMAVQPHSPEYPIWLVSSSYDNVDAIFEIMAWTCKEKLGNLTNRTSMKFRILQLSNGAIIKGKSAEEPASLEAKGLWFLVCDECREIKNIVWEERLEARILDTNARVLCLTSGCKKKGNYNWFYKLAQQAKRPDGDCDYFEYPSNMNPAIKSSEFERKRRTLPKHVFDERYMGKMISDTVEMWANFDKVFCLHEKSPVGGKQYIAGIDVGITNDLTTYAIFDSVTKEEVACGEMPRKLDYHAQLDRLKGVLTYYNNPITMVDATGVGSGGFFQDLRKAGMNVQPFFISTKAIRNKLIEDAMVRFDNMSWFLIDDERVKTEFEDMTCDLKQSLTPTYQSLSGHSPDRLMAKLLANQLLEDEVDGTMVDDFASEERVYQPDNLENKSDVFANLGEVEEFMG